MFPLPLRQINHSRRYAVLEGFLSGFECEGAIAVAMKVPEVQATVSVERLTDERARKSSLRWLNWTTETDWLFQKLGQAAQLLNERVFGFDLAGIQEIQMTEYRAPGGHYDYHVDEGEGNMSTRKLSMTVQLSDPSDYEGGDFELFQLNQRVPKSRGTVIAFPSYAYHKVHPVTAGIRKSLVAWVQGPLFR